MKFANDIERVENIYRKHVYLRIFKLFETLICTEKNQYQYAIKLLEEKLKLSNSTIEEQKQERY